MSDSDSNSSSSGEDSHAARIAADPFNASHVKECEKERVALHLVFYNAADNKLQKDSCKSSKDAGRSGSGTPRRSSGEHGHANPYLPGSSTRPSSANASRSSVGSDRRSSRDRTSDEGPSTGSGSEGVRARPMTAMPRRTPSGTQQVSFQVLITPHEALRQAVVKDSPTPPESPHRRPDSAHSRQASSGLRRSKSFGSSSAGIESALQRVEVEGMSYSRKFSNAAAAAANTAASQGGSSILRAFLQAGQPSSPDSPHMMRPASAHSHSAHRQAVGRPGVASPMETNRSRGVSLEVRKHLDAQWEEIRGAMTSGTPLRGTPIQSGNSSRQRRSRPHSSAATMRSELQSSAAQHGALSMHNGQKIASQKIQQAATSGTGARGTRNFLAPSSHSPNEQRYHASGIRYRNQPPLPPSRSRTAKKTLETAHSSPFASIPGPTSTSLSARDSQRLQAAWHGEQGGGPSSPSSRSARNEYLYKQMFPGR